MIDNNSQWFIWSVGWGCLVGAAYLHAGNAAALTVLGLGFLRASGLVPDSSLSTVLTSILAALKGKP